MANVYTIYSPQKNGKLGVGVPSLYTDNERFFYDIEEITIDNVEDFVIHKSQKPYVDEYLKDEGNDKEDSKALMSFVKTIVGNSPEQQRYEEGVDDWEDSMKMHMGNHRDYAITIMDVVDYLTGYMYSPESRDISEVNEFIDEFNEDGTIEALYDAIAILLDVATNKRRDEENE